MKVIIAGYGFVGKAVHDTFKLKHEVVIVDPKLPDTQQIKDHHDADCVIVCVGTPSTEDGGCDDSQIRAVLDATPMFLPVLIKSTVLPSQLAEIESDYEDYSICYSPEFLRANTASKDFLDQKYVVVGGEDPDCFWHELFLDTLPNCKIVFNCTNIEASTVKYSINSFLATKVAFFNQIYDICGANGADFDMVRHLISQDTRIGSGHTLVPGLDGERGFGGHCFPKDTKAFAKYAENLNNPITILDEVAKYNRSIRK